MKHHADATAWLADQSAWVPELAALRSILRDTGLEEAIKWGAPTYRDGDHNVVNLGARKDGAIVGFFRGALLSDPGGELDTPGAHSRHVRTLTFRSVAEVEARRPLLQDFVAEAVRRTRAGETVPKPDPADLDLPDELIDRMDADPAFAEAFWGMTPGRRRGHALHIGGAKTAKGRASRLLAATPRILAGKGRQECICGRSARMPRCDGTHSKPA
jgi:uncharacterized protein YdeI (YjbR/CyaY-like superfamily)